jgi:hypothetical protein
MIIKVQTYTIYGADVFLGRTSLSPRFEVLTEQETGIFYGIFYKETGIFYFLCRLHVDFASFAPVNDWEERLILNRKSQKEIEDPFQRGYQY